MQIHCMGALWFLVSYSEDGQVSVKLYASIVQLKSSMFLEILNSIQRGITRICWLELKSDWKNWKLEVPTAQSITVEQCWCWCYLFVVIYFLCHCVAMALLSCPTIHTSVHPIYIKKILQAALMDFFLICHKCSLTYKDELMKIWWSKVPVTFVNEYYDWILLSTNLYHVTKTRRDAT